MYWIRLILFLIGFIFFHSCHFVLISNMEENQCERNCPNGSRYYNSYSVQTISLEELKAQISVEDPKPYQSTGKFYFYNDLMFVNDPNVGIHVLDVANAANISKVKYINLPGNIEVSIRNNMMYADIYGAMLSLDISNLMDNELRIKGENIGIFEYNAYNEAWRLIEEQQPENDLIKQLEYRELDNIEGLGETVFISGIIYNGVRCDCLDIYYLEKNITSDTSTGGQSPLTGEGGSLARFKVVDDYLYALNNKAIKLFRFKEDGTLQNWSTVDVRWGIETVYRLEDYLFIGSTTGMFIYDITDPGNPSFISNYNHFRACDPVVAAGNYAYVTLRSTNNWCTGSINQLQIIDISEIFEPEPVSVYNLNAPYGLAYREDRVLVCDGGSGLKIIDVTDKKAPKVVGFIDDIDPRDIILIKDLAYVVTKEGMVIYSISDLENPQRLSIQNL